MRECVYLEQRDLVLLRDFRERRQSLGELNDQLHGQYGHLGDVPEVDVVLVLALLGGILLWTGDWFWGSVR